MAEGLTPNFGEGAPIGPQPGQWTPTYPAQAVQRSRVWPATVLASISILLAIAAVIVALAKKPSAAVPASAPAPTYTPADVAAAKQQLCDTYKLEARTVRSDTGGSDEALARIAATNGAVMLYHAAANPALDAKYRDAARALATAYGNVSALGSKGIATDAEWRAVLEDANAKDAAMKNLCGGD